MTGGWAALACIHSFMAPSYRGATPHCLRSSVEWLSFTGS